MTQNDERAFDAMAWHDAVLLALCIDRRSPGARDEVVLSVEWPVGRKQKIVFADCYGLDAQMNFGVVAPESIASGRCISASPQVSELRQRWLATGVDLEALRCFEIVTNSTASRICVFAIRYEVFDSE